MAYVYTTSDPRFGKNEIVTIKDMMIRYRTRGWDVKADGTRMTKNEVFEDILTHEVKCVTEVSFK